MDSLCDLIRNDLQLNLDSDRAVLVAQETVRYLCGVSDAYAYQHFLKENVRFRSLGFSAKDFRLALIEKSYLTLNIKFFALNLCKRKVETDVIHHFANAFDIVRNDAVMLRRAFLDKRFRRSMRASDRVKDMQLEDIEEGSVERTQRDFNDMYSDLMKHIRQKTFSKLRFLVKSENQEFADFNGEILYKAIKAFYMLVPSRKSPAYVLNYLRATCTNCALNIISEKTSGKRRRLVNAGADGFGGQSFSLTCVSENQLQSIDGDELFYDSTLNDVNSGDNSKMISELHFERLVSTMGKSKLRRRAILIISGQEDSRFTRYLHTRELIKPDEDCADFVQRTKHENVVAHLASHLGVDDARLSRFLRKVGTELIKHRSVA